MLKVLVIVNLFASGGHFLHNAVFLDSYPGPDWISNPWMVVAAWFLVAAVLILGYRWYRRGDLAKASVAIPAYCVSCFFVFGHYVYGSPLGFDLLSNVLIFGEGLAAAALLVYYIGWARFQAPGTPV